MLLYFSLSLDLLKCHEEKMKKNPGHFRTIAHILCNFSGHFSGQLKKTLISGQFQQKLMTKLKVIGQEFSNCGFLGKNCHFSQFLPKK